MPTTPANGFVLFQTCSQVRLASAPMVVKLVTLIAGVAMRSASSGAGVRDPSGGHE